MTLCRLGKNFTVYVTKFISKIYKALVKLNNDKIDHLTHKYGEMKKILP